MQSIFMGPVERIVREKSAREEWLAVVCAVLPSLLGAGTGGGNTGDKLQGAVVGAGIVADAVLSEADRRFAAHASKDR